MRRLICIACRDRVALEGSEVHCRCGRSTAKLAANGWGYIGPAMVAVVIPSHEPSARRMGERIVQMPDDDVSHRAAVEPLL
jgi:hypothetical protein